MDEIWGDSREDFWNTAYMKDLKKDFWKTAFGFNRTQSIPKRISEFVVTASFIAIAIILLVSILQGLFADNLSWEEYCEDSPSLC